MTATPTPAAPGAGRTGRALTARADDVAVMIGRSLRHSARNPEALFTAVLLPVMLLMLFVYVFGRVMDTGGTYVDYVLPGIILLCSGFGAGSTAIAVATDMEEGIVDRFRTMPMHGTAVITGHVAASVARNLLATGIVVAVGLLVGWRPTAGPAEWIAAAALVTLFITAVSWLAAAGGLLARTAEAANAFTFVFMFLPYVSSAFVPTDSLPAGLRWFAEYQPVTPVIETLRGLWMGTPIGTEWVWALVWCAGIVAAGYAASAVLFARRTGR